MTDGTTEPTQSAPAAPAPSSPSPAAAPDPSAAPAADPAPSYSHPDAYKDKPYLKNLKSVDDVYKALDGAQELIGKKSIPFDYSKATPEEIEAHHTAIRPKEAAEYAKPEGWEVSEEQIGAYQKVLYEEGVPKAVGDKLLAKVAALDAEQMTLMFGKDAYEGMLKESFGEDAWQKKGGETATFIKQYTSPEDQALMEKVPNQLLGVMYRMADKIKEAHGIKETSVAVGGESTAPKVDIVAERAKIRQELREVTNKPHTAAQKAALQARLDATYKVK